MTTDDVLYGTCPVCGKPVENCDDTAACEDYWNARMMEADDGKSD